MEPRRACGFGALDSSLARRRPVRRKDGESAGYSAAMAENGRPASRTRRRTMQILKNPRRDPQLAPLPWSERMFAAARDAEAWLALCPSHRPTPLVRWQPWQDTGPTLWLKDETQRMRAGSFKALGGAYAVMQLALAAARRVEPGLGLRELVAGAGRAGPQLEVCCASAGNHGLSVAIGARLVGCRCTVFVAQTVPESFVQRLQSAGASVVRAGAHYEASMAAAQAHAERPGIELVSDSSWPGYTEVPLLIMAGYLRIPREAMDEAAQRGVAFTHVLVQAGVGGLAAAVGAALRAQPGDTRRLIVVEPEVADCLSASAAAGRIVEVSGPASNMGRLDCKRPSMIAYELLAPACDDWITLGDDEAARGTALLQPLIGSTPSGAAGVAAALLAWSDENRREQLGLTPQSQLLCFVTEQSQGSPIP